MLFAPDWRAGGPYQSELSKALVNLDTDVQFASGYRRALPLARVTWQFQPDILHLHWPEAYFPLRGDFLDELRERRLPVDARLARLGRRLVVTAHNLFPHSKEISRPLEEAVSSVHRLASAVIAHSEEARQVVSNTHGVDPERIFVIPHGDLAPSMSRLTDRESARRRLSLPDRRICLIFGRVEPYKGIDVVVDFWNAVRPDADLYIVGNDSGNDYVRGLSARIDGNPSIRTVLRHVPDQELADWLSATDCVLFNYRTLLTSGAASLTRSMGVPLLIPSRLNTVDLGEPDPRVFRFGSIAELSELLPRALAAGSDYEAAAGWRRRCSWDGIAEETRKVYDFVLKEAPCAG